MNLLIAIVLLLAGVLNLLPLRKRTRLETINRLLRQLRFLQSKARLLNTVVKKKLAELEKLIEEEEQERQKSRDA